MIRIKSTASRYGMTASTDVFGLTAMPTFMPCDLMACINAPAGGKGGREEGVGVSNQVCACAFACACACAVHACMRP
jgi:hypothetical protein